MSLYADILRGYDNLCEETVRQEDDETWTVLAVWIDEEIPGFPDKGMALAVARACWNAYQRGGDAVSYS